MKKLKSRTKFILFILLSISVFGSTSRASQLTLSNIQTEKAAINKVIKDTEELEKFCDDFFTENMKKDNIPGAAVSIVEGGKIIYKKGYGFADIENSIPVNPDKTAFYICSTGKLFTGTAIMQLYEKGKIKNLTDNINLYQNKINFGNKFKKPVTFSNLLTHTSGLDEGSVIGGASKTKNGVLSYEDYLNLKLTRVIREPDLFTRYSNLGYDLLGYLVQSISGLTFKDYINKNILLPLDMANSTAGDKPENLAKPYILEGNLLKPQTDELYFPGLGEGCVYSTAGDMAKFMLAHLQNGNYKGKSILREETVKLMHEQHFTNNSALPGMCYSFLQSYENGQRAIKHEGADAMGYICTLYLLPEKKLGFFVECNSLSMLPILFENKFLDHYFPSNKSELKDFSIKREYENNGLTGTYRSYDDISVSTILKVLALLSGDGEIKISEKKDGSLVMKNTNIEGKTATTGLFNTSDLIYQSADKAAKIAFKKDKSGKISYLFTNEPHKTFEKIHWYESRLSNLILFSICILFFIINIIRITISALIKRIKTKAAIFSRLELTSTIFLYSSSILNVSGILAFTLMLSSVSYKIQSGFPAIGYISLLFLHLGTIVSGGTIFCSLYKLFSKNNSIFNRIHCAISVIICIAFVLFLSYWNFLGFKLN